jgi:hypothetical protein
MLGKLSGLFGRKKQGLVQTEYVAQQGQSQVDMQATSASEFNSAESRAFVPPWFTARLESQEPLPLEYAPTIGVPKKIPIEVLAMMQQRVNKVSVRMPSSFELFKVLNDPKSTPHQVADVAKKDPKLVAAILRTVNSAALGVREEITSVGRAIILLGYNNVKALALHHSFSGGEPLSPEKRRLWVHSSMVSSAAYWLAAKFQLDKGELGTIGLLHDIGGILVEGKDLAEVSKLIQVPEKVLESMIGGLLAKYWELPGRVSNVIKLYPYTSYYTVDSLDVEFRRQCVVIAVADAFCNLMGYGDNTTKHLPSMAYLQHVGLSEDYAEWFSAADLAEIDKTRTILESLLV